MPGLQKKPQLLLFGSTGTIGRGVQQTFASQGWAVTGVTRQATNESGQLCWNPLQTSNDQRALDALKAVAPFDAVCWAQGQNCNDNIYDVDVAVHEELYRANCLYILASLQPLLQQQLLAVPARLCIVSSIWQNLSRQNKLSYGMTKAALQGLVLSMANDLGRDRHLVNAVLPGALDTPMTRQNLSPQQIASIAGATQFNSLSTIEDVASMVYFLCSPQNTGVTGQFIKVDLGFSDVRIV